MDKYFVILSEGSYSDYSPIYYMGDREITDDEFKAKGIEIGDALLDDYENAPERTVEYLDQWSGRKEQIKKKYDPQTGEEMGHYNLDDFFISRMTSWLNEQGFFALPSKIPEINVNYSDIPHSVKKDEEIKPLLMAVNDDGSIAVKYHENSISK